MKIQKTHYIPQTLLDTVNRYLTENLDHSDSLGEDEAIRVVVRLTPWVEMSIDCCGVQYEENGSNTAYTQAVLYVRGAQTSFTEPCEDFEGEWELSDHEGNTYVVDIVPVKEVVCVDTFKFENGQQMYEYLDAGCDLYNKKLGIYVFGYNDAGALCYYYLDDDDVSSILAVLQGSDESWSACLGPGGHILDESKYNDEEHRYSEDEAKRAMYLQPSFEFCEKFYAEEGWTFTGDITL